MEYIQTIIIGGGQAGLSTSYFLNQRGGRDHLILEQSAAAGSAWRRDRWDSFTLLTPNWASQLPGMPPHADADAFLTKQQISSMFDHYVENHHLPIQYRTKVLDITQGDHGFLVNTDRDTYRADNVVVATGLYQRPRIPSFSANLPPDIVQVASGQYRHPDALPAGAVLVVGSGQSGCQIAEELYLSGRKVYLCVSPAPRVPRRYRGRDIFEWLSLNGFLDRTADKLPSPRARFMPNPQLSGKNGGANLNLHQFVRDGVVLLGRIIDVDNGGIILADDLMDSLAKTDQAEANIITLVDSYIAQQGLDAPQEQLPHLRDAYAVEVIRTLNLRTAGISAVIWATGYTFDFSMVKMAQLDEDGYPQQQRGVTSVSGLYFIGLPWLFKPKSGLLLGVGEDADYLAEYITTHNR